MGIENFITFVITALLFIMTPGIDTVFVLNKSIGQGRKAGFYAALGINTGVLSHTLLGALGLSMLIANAPYVFAFIKYIGVAYLIYLGALKLKNQKNLLGITTETTKKNSKNDFWSGFLTNTLNPKVALFFLAFFPQFINTGKLDSSVPFLILGVTYAFIGFVWYLIINICASAFRKKIINNPKFGIWIHKLSGLVFILIGIKIALS